MQPETVFISREILKKRIIMFEPVTAWFIGSMSHDIFNLLKVIVIFRLTAASNRISVT